MYLNKNINEIILEIFLKDEFIYPRKKLIKKMLYEIYWKKNVLHIYFIPF